MGRDFGLEKLEKPQSLDEQAYLHIKKALLDGVFRPGEFLAEVRLAEKLGISKTPIRKAMARLQQDGFLVNVPYKGYYVADVSAKDIIEIYQLREILECYLVRETAQRFTPAELDDMESVLQASEEAFEEGDYVGFVVRNREFHHVFDRKCSNQRISNVLTNLDEHVWRILLYELQDEQSVLLASHRDHHLILEAIREDNVEFAVHLMRNHLAGFCEVLVARMKSTE